MTIVFSVETKEGPRPRGSFQRGPMIKPERGLREALRAPKTKAEAEGAEQRCGLGMARAAGSLQRTHNLHVCWLPAAPVTLCPVSGKCQLSVASSELCCPRTAASLYLDCLHHVPRGLSSSSSCFPILPDRHLSRWPPKRVPGLSATSGVSHQTRPSCRHRP